MPAHPSPIPSPSPPSAADPERPVPSPSSAGGDETGRRHLEWRVETARQEAVAWTASAPNAERIGAYLTSYGDVSVRSVTAPRRTLADYAALLTEWDVPGVRAPPDLSALLAERWARSVTVAVLHQLRRAGHLL